VQVLGPHGASPQYPASSANRSAIRHDRPVWCPRE
jgi:hypothetical protein